MPHGLVSGGTEILVWVGDMLEGEGGRQSNLLHCPLFDGLLSCGTCTPERLME